MYNYNKKSRVSSILLIVTAIALVGLMILMAALFSNIDGDKIASDGEGAAVAAAAAVFAIAIVAVVGLFVFYAASIPFVIFAAVLGILMRVERSRRKLIRHNVTMLVVTCLLMPFIGTGLAWSGIVISVSAAPLFPTAYTLLVAFLYLACFVTQIVTIVVLKKSPVEETTEPPIVEWQ